MRSRRRRDYCRFGPFRVSIIPQGLIKPFILKLLSERPMHGFEIMEEIFHHTFGMWRPGPSSIYPALIQLEEEGYIDYERFRKEWLENVSQLRRMWL
jgi:hypothetical protein